MRSRTPQEVMEAQLRRNRDLLNWPRIVFNDYLRFGEVAVFTPPKQLVNSESVFISGVFFSETYLMSRDTYRAHFVSYGHHDVILNNWLREMDAPGGEA